MSRTSLLKTALLTVLISYAAGCVSDRAAEPEPAPIPPLLAEVDSATVEYRRGDEAFADMNLDKAMTHYARALEWDSTKAEAYVGRGRIYWFQLQYDRAVPELDSALALNPDLPWAYYFRGLSLMNLRHFEDAIDDLTKALATEALPADFIVTAQHFRAIGHMNLEQYDDAIADLTTCIGFNPNQPIYRLERAALYEAVGRPTDAIPDYEAFLTISESFVAANAESAEDGEETEQPVEVLQKMEEIRTKLATLRE